MLKRFINGFVKINKKLSDLILSKLPDELDLSAHLPAISLKGKKILEIGGNIRPRIGKGNYLYVGMDIEDIGNPLKFYDQFILGDIQKLDMENAFDAIFSFYLLEHVRDNNLSLQNIHRALKERGIFYSLLPNRNQPILVLNRIIPNSIVKRLIHWLRPWTEDVAGYPAYYHLCSPALLKRELELLNFKNIQIDARYSICDYFSFFFPFFMAAFIFDSLLKIFSVTRLCSAFVIRAEK